MDLDTLSARVESALSRWDPSARLSSLRELSGGQSSLTYIAELAGSAVDRVVLKVAHAGQRATLNRDVLRQARVLRTLSPLAGIEVPPVYFEDPGTGIASPPFFAMGYISGESFEPHMSGAAENSPRPDVVSARARSGAAMLARLHAVRPDEFVSGEPAVTPADEVARWTRTFETVDPEFSVDSARCARLLMDHHPDSPRVSLCHGDYRLGNMLCQGTDIRAVVDWEIWSVTDPRIDLAWFLMNADPSNPMVSRTCPGMPTPEELLAVYADETGTHPADMTWFHALVRYKLAATVALILKHRRRRNRGEGQLPLTVNTALTQCLNRVDLLTRKEIPWRRSAARRITGRQRPSAR